MALKLKAKPCFFVYPHSLTGMCLLKKLFLLSLAYFISKIRTCNRTGSFTADCKTVMQGEL